MKYVSKRKELSLVMRPADRILDDKRQVIVLPGKRVDFIDGKFETHDPETIEWLSKHRTKGMAFMEITESDERTVAKAQSSAPKIITGAMDATSRSPEMEVSEETTRPEQTVMVSPELLKIIDDKITSALGSIIDLLQQDKVKEEKVAGGKPTKTFKCPYCGEPQPSGFAVGKHKAVCPKRPKVV